MTARLVAISFAALEPGRLAGFWADLLGWPAVDSTDPSTEASTGERAEVWAVRPTDDTGFVLRFRPTDEPKTQANLMHLDLTSRSWAEQERTVATALRLGGRHLDVGQLPEEQHVVLADPEGNELCVIEPGNAFLADCGAIGAVAGEGTAPVGRFWSAALGWPLVWDQDEETAVRSPSGGPKLTWGGPPAVVTAGPSRVQLELAATGATSLVAETARLVGLGATSRGPDRATGAEQLLDPDGHEFRLFGA